MRKQLNTAIKFLITGLVIVVGLLFIMGYAEYKNTANADPVSAETSTVSTLNSNSHNGWGVSGFFK